MKHVRAVAFVAVLCPAVVWAKTLLAEKSRAYQPTAVSSQWPTFTSKEGGFRIQYPPDKWIVKRFKDRVDLRSGESVRLSVLCLAGPMKPIMKEVQHDFNLSRWVSSEGVTINGLPGRRMNYFQSYFDTAGVDHIESLFVPRDDRTYMISWSLGRGADKDSKEYAAACREIVGTFGFVEVEHRDRLNYTSQAFHFSFDYRPDWELTEVSRSHVIVSPSPGSSISMDVRPRSEFDFEEWRSHFTGMSAKAEFFEHHLPGHRCLWFGRETYILENRENFYLVEVESARGLPAEPRSVVDGILDSLTL
jgi:hypothetical protein